MRKLLFLLILLVTALGCRSRKIDVQEERKKEVQQLEVKRDSVFSESKTFKTSVLAFENTQSIELELESDIDSIGNAKSITVERIRSLSGEKITVTGGKARLKITDNNKQNVIDNNTIINTKADVQTQQNKRQIKENKSFEKQKEVQVKGFGFGIYLLLILILIALCLAWRLKLFRHLMPVVNLIKRLLKKV